MWLSPMGLQYLSIEAAAQEVAKIEASRRTKARVEEILSSNGVTYMSQEEKEFFNSCIKRFSRH